MKTLCPVCNKKYISKEFMEKHADAEHPDWRVAKSKGWATPWGFADFSKPVTYEHACAEMKKMREAMLAAPSQEKDND